jgi:hypothetical protein
MEKKNEECIITVVIPEGLTACLRIVPVATLQSSSKRKKLVLCKIKTFLYFLPGFFSPVEVKRVERTFLVVAVLHSTLFREKKNIEDILKT